MKIRFAMPFQNKPNGTEGGGGETAEQKAAADAAAKAAAAGGKTPEQLAAEKKTADDAAAAAAAAANAGKTPEQIAAEKKAADDAAAAAAKSKAPEKYELTKPEGDYVDDADIEAVSAIAKANGWTNEEAQAELAAEAEMRKLRREQFLEQTKKHAEVGGDKLAPAQALATAAMDRFLPADTPDGKLFRAELTKNGFANWAPLVVLLSRIGAAMGEDSGPLAGKGGGGVKETKFGDQRQAAGVMFGGGEKT